METDLELDIRHTEEDFPDYDEYLYNVGEISHNPYELMGYLSAVYSDFTYAQTKSELERIFAGQYRLDRQEAVETRTGTGEDGEEETYEWRILKTTLTVRPLSEIIGQNFSRVSRPISMRSICRPAATDSVLQICSPFRGYPE